MVTVLKSVLKARMLEYFRKVEQTGEELIVTSNGRPVLRFVPYKSHENVSDLFADVRGRLSFTDDPDAPTSTEWRLERSGSYPIALGDRTQSSARYTPARHRP